MSKIDSLDPSVFVDLRVDGDIKLKRYINKGKIGLVYYAEDDRNELDYACKLIPADSLKQGWERELEKVRKLKKVSNVVQYRGSNSVTGPDHRPYVWVCFDYVDGWNLREFVKAHPEEIDIPFVELFIRTLLSVLHACTVQGIIHGDLHEGNILIGKPDPRSLGPKRKSIWVNDFGFGGSHNDIQPKDDYQQLASMVQSLLSRITQSSLNARDKILHNALNEFAQKRIRDGVRTPNLTAERLFADFEGMIEKANRESVFGYRDSDDDVSKMPADYLWAEAIGLRSREWRDLFVPRFLAASDLLARNNTVLTGARGCGKTMSFRRMTRLMDRIIGEPSSVPGSETFVGFYLNSRDITDAFPWVPGKLNSHGEQQVMHFFHLAWVAEALRTLAQDDPKEKERYAWLERWFTDYYKARYVGSIEGESQLGHLRAFIEIEKERCRSTQLGDAHQTWELARTTVLDSFFKGMQENVDWAKSVPCYLFLDDYTLPLIPPSIQRTLNPIIFRRRSDIFFKISTEASNSFLPTGINDKALELHHDFALLDLATESLHQPDKEKEILLDAIFRPRIKRFSTYASVNLGLEEVLGATPYSYNKLAKQLRESKGGSKTKVLYHGVKVFTGLWTSDIRTMVEMLNDMLRAANGSLSAESPEIPKEIQDERIRTQGGELMTFTQSIRDYQLWKGVKSQRSKVENFGNHLKTIVEVFMQVSRFELMEGPLIKNEKNHNPRQAFRIEVVDSFQPTEIGKVYLDGLVRYHVFLQDWRGKSQRGMLTPRLYLNRVFLPHGGLTLSSKDHIQLTNVELMKLLERPDEFFSYWRKKRAPKPKNQQSQMFE